MEKRDRRRRQCGFDSISTNLKTSAHFNPIQTIWTKEIELECYGSYSAYKNTGKVFVCGRVVPRVVACLKTFNKGIRTPNVCAQFKNIVGAQVFIEVLAIINRPIRLRADFFDAQMRENKNTLPSIIDKHLHRWISSTLLYPVSVKQGTEW